MKLKSLSAAITVAIASFAAHASDENIVVVGSALDQLVQTEINAETLELKQASDIKDVLNTMPSVTVDGNARYSRKVYIRGMEDKFSVVTIDGARQEGQLFHHSGDQTFDPAMLKLAEITLGGNSVLSGAGAINGSFKYETKDPSDLLSEGESVGARVKTGYQTAYERFTTNVAVYAQLNDELQLMGIINYSEDGDLYIPGKDDVTSKQGELKSGLVKLVFVPNDANEFKLTFNTYQDGGKRQLSGEKAGALYLHDDHNYNSLNRDTVTFEHRFDNGSDLVNLKTNLYYNRQYMERDALVEEYGDWKKVNGAWEFTKDGDLSIPDREYNVTTIGGDIRNISWVGEHELTYGFEGYKAEQWIDSGLGHYTSGSKQGQTKNYDMDGGTVTAYGIYAQDAFEINDFRFVTGLRYDVHELGGVFKGKYDQLSPKFQGEYQTTDNLKLRIGYGRLFKGASLPETLTMKAASDVKQSDTKAMTGNNYEAGFDYDMSGLLMADDAILGFTAYQYDLDNQMHPTKNNTTLVNQYDVEVWGVETVFTYSIEDFALYANHSYSDGEQTSLKNGKKSHMNKTGIHNIKAGFKYDLTSEFVFGWDSRFVPGNDYKDEDGDKIERAGFATHNLWAAYVPDFAKDLSLNLAVDNLFNKQYAEHTGFGISWGSDKYTSYEAGRNFKASVAYSF
ncbi:MULTISPECIES: TonB-dependent receptor [Vibrio]|jgi:hemoglobin/transferrin/lactoferrin receptor protein|uniref:TonB-dependent receptor n=2 Tax=Vibrio harveyi TaxID=669 RepID=A0A3A1Q6L8_VIBHA|nr:MULTISPECIES: TonB-dependent receptor [Vibrio]AMF99986.1 TonB-dependent receptor [Vibrio harveyi]APP08680.1 ligand-gated channel protein [Vibrio harveyi]EKM25900.1 tonB-dependent Receptor Plug domain protein [Vibrio harveyi]EKO3798417.1 TonB-dependent receptor [Vibrio harveyi]EKO3804823.1 TonB-dependent receptor [Vibrio harveyi]